jgi:hypothetical protein
VRDVSVSEHFLQRLPRELGRAACRSGGRSSTSRCRRSRRSPHHLDLGVAASCTCDEPDALGDPCGNCGAVVHVGEHARTVVKINVRERVGCGALSAGDMDRGRGPDYAGRPEERRDGLAAAARTSRSRGRARMAAGAAPSTRDRESARTVDHLRAGISCLGGLRRDGHQAPQLAAEALVAGVACKARCSELRRARVARAGARSASGPGASRATAGLPRHKGVDRTTAPLARGPEALRATRWEHRLAASAKTKPAGLVACGDGDRVATFGRW